MPVDMDPAHHDSGGETPDARVPSGHTPPLSQIPWYRDTKSWPFFIVFCLAALLFLALEIAYQYYVLLPGIVTISLLRGAALAGTTLISASLFSSAIFKWWPKTAIHWRIRRYLGVAGASWITLHVISAVLWQFNGNIPAVFYTFNPIENPIIYGVAAFVIYVIMMLTSTDWAMRLLGRHWKTIHRFVYFAFASSILHFLFTAPQNLLNPAGYLLLLVTGLAVAGQLYWFMRTVAPKRFATPGTLVGFLIIVYFVSMLVLSSIHKRQVDRAFENASRSETQLMQ